MPVITKGFPQLEARIRAISAPNEREMMMRRAGLAVVGEMKLRIPRKTATTSRSIILGHVDANSAEVIGSPVAAYLDTGTGLYGPYRKRIVPKHASVLAWKTASNPRPSGRARAGTRSGWAFARSTAGMRARPYRAAAVRAAAKKIGMVLAADIIQRWNDAA